MTENEMETQVHENEKTRVPTSEKAPQPSVSEIICPLIYKTTGRAVNYDVNWTSTVKLGENEAGSWRSAPQNRPGHSKEFYDALDKLREEGKIPWPENAFYFTHEQGITARKAYEQDVLTGKTKANKRSWENRFAQLTGVSFEDLTNGAHVDENERKKFIELYMSTPATSSSKKSDAEPAESQTYAAPSMDFDDVVTPIAEETVVEEATEEEPLAEDLDQIEHDAVAAVTAVEDAEEVVGSEDDDSDNHGITVLRLTGYMNPERLSEDSFVRRINGEDVRFYEVELPELDGPIFVPEMDISIGGTYYRLVADEEENSSSTNEE